MNRRNEPPHDESDRALDRAIRAAMAAPAPVEIGDRVIRTALGFAAGGPGPPRGHFLERVKHMIRTRKRLSVAAAAAVAALAACLALAISLASPSVRAYTLEQTAQANNQITSYHVKITPAAELGEAWVQLAPDGTPIRARMDFQSLWDGAKVVIHSKGRAEVWMKDKNSLLIIPEADALERISQMRNLADPKLAFERLQADQAAGKVEVETRQPAKDGEPIVLTVTSKTKPDQRQVYEVDPRAKLVQRVTSYRRSGEEWQPVALRQYLDYNQPIDPKVFRPEMPRDVTVIDQINRKPGLVKGDLSDDEIAAKVVRAFFEALIAGDYDKAGAIYEGAPGDWLKKHLGPVRFLRIVEIGRPAPARDPLLKALQAPARVEIELEGRREVRDYTPFVRPPYGQPDRRVICGGI